MWIIKKLQKGKKNFKVVSGICERTNARIVWDNTEETEKLADIFKKIGMGAAKAAKNLLLKLRTFQLAR